MIGLFIALCYGVGLYIAVYQIPKTMKTIMKEGFKK